MLQIKEMTENDRRIELPPEKVKAVLVVFDQVLFTQGQEAQNILDSMRGRRGRGKPLTFGELVGLADESKISAAAIAIGITDLGSGPPVDLARVLHLIAHPSIAICENKTCSRYAVAEEGGVVTLLIEGRCPFCGSLITAPKQEEPFIAWTTGLEMAPAVTHDRITIPHLPLPLRNDVVLTEAGGNLYSISPTLLQAMQVEGLEIVLNEKTGEKVPSISHFLHFLSRGPLSSRFRGKDEVLISLGNTRSFGAYDLTSLRSVVRDAKGWRPSSANTPPPHVHMETASGVPLSLSREQMKILRQTLARLIPDQSGIKLVIHDSDLSLERVRDQAQFSWGHSG